MIIMRFLFSPHAVFHCFHFPHIGVERFRILGGGKGGQIPSRHMTLL